MRDTVRVAVYGTLQRGECNHGVLGGARYLGTDDLTRIVLYELGGYPGAHWGASDGIQVEVYAVDAMTLIALDELEECVPDAPAQGLYRREPIETRFGTAWIYLYNPPVPDQVPIRQGRWRGQPETVRSP
ncbi:MAG: gamma-glutamylcyclotransferase [Gammaproteobacteria bacterium]|nr:gamma-glutamylcyclotransferase [Gammaproteobacteria bacterium]